MSQKPTAYWPTPRTRGLLGGSGSRQMMEAKVQNGELSKDEAEQMMGTAVRYATPKARDYRTGTGSRWQNKQERSNLNDQIAHEEGYRNIDAPNAWSQLHLLPVDSHVRMSQSQGNAQVSKTAPGQDSGQSFTESFANYDPDTSSWRTSQACLLTGWAEFSATFPPSGTMRNGRCYRRQMSAHRTYVNESSSPHITEFPTPAATSYGSSGNEGGGNTLSAHRPSLETMARKNKWPTPRAADYKGAQKPSPTTKRRVEEGIANLPEALQENRRMWPTPKSTVSGPDHARKNREGSGGDDLATAAAKWPTPRASEWKGTGPLGSKSHGHRLKKKYLDATVQEAEQITGQLNPTWVERLMGFPSGWTDLKA